MFNPPPSDLHKRDPLIYTCSAGQIWYRSYQVSHGPIFFGKGKLYRWDSPTGDYGVLYLGADEYCAFIESIGRGVLKTRFVSASVLRQRTFSKVLVKGNLRLIDMVNSGGLARLGAEGSIVSGTGYRNSQRWSATLKDHPSKPDGIYYRSRHDPARTSCALFDSSAGMIEVAQTYASWAAEKTLLGAILDNYHFGTDL